MRHTVARLTPLTEAIHRPAAQSRWWLLALIPLTAWGCFQCFWNLGTQNVSYDERLYDNAGWAYLHGDFGLNREHPPTAKYLFGLAQALAGRDILAGRIVVALAVLAGGVILLFWLRLELGWGPAVLAAGLWWVMPRGGFDVRQDRAAMLDPMMTLFLIAALAAAWMWMRSGRWWWLPFSAVAMALSVTAKAPTLMVLPAFLLLPLLCRRWQAFAIGGPIWAIVFATTVAALYAPMGIPGAIADMIAFQSAHDAAGHSIDIFGHLYQFAPWWANLWFFADGVSPPLTAVLCLGLVLGVVLRPGPLVGFIGSALLLLLVFFVGIARVALNTYYYPMTVLVLVVAVVGYTRLAPMCRRSVFAVILAAAVVLAAIASAVLSAQIAQIRPTGIARLAATLQQDQPHTGNILFQSLSPFWYLSYFPDTGTASLDGQPFRAIVVGQDARLPVDPQVAALLARDPGSFEHITLDDLQVWIPRGVVTTKVGVLSVAPG